MDIYLVRHAIAGERDPALWPDDSERPLTPKGEKRFKQSARGLTRVLPAVDALLTSPFQRARQTASILHKAGWPEPQPLDELAQGDPGALLRALQPFRHLSSVALVGHEPHLSRFVAAALGSHGAPWREMKKGGAVHLRMAGPSFTGKAELGFYLTPRVMRSIS